MKITAALITLLATSTAAATPEGLGLDRVLLSSGGVAYFEYMAEADGDASLKLTVPLDQVDDLLKSLVVFDDGGRVTGVSLPGREPLAQRFRELPFSPGDLNSPVTLLNALRGERVSVAQPRRIEGQLLRVEPVPVLLPDGLGTITRHRVSILADDGLRQTVLEDTQGLRFSDPELHAEVQAALEAIADYRDQDSRIIAIATHGDRPREVRAGYVTAAPLWKASYRLVLTPDADSAHAQGWAHLENLSGQDWDGISLTLASGNPVTFRQALYQAYYVSRPEVPVEVAGRVLPPMDSGALQQAPRGAKGQLARKRSLGMAMGAAVGGRMEMEEAFADADRAAMPASAPAPAPGMAGMTLAAAGSDAAEQVLFTLPTPVHLANGHALMTPIVDRALPAERLSLYQPGTHAQHPLDSVRVSNDGAQPLPPGVVTLYGDGDGVSFLGDARLDGLPAGDSRLLSFALDRQMRIQREHRQQSSISAGSISKGLLHLTRRERAITRYRVKSLGQRRLWLEQPRRAGWKLVEPTDAVIETTAGQYRLAFDFEPGEERTLEVIEQRPRAEQMALNTLNRRQLALFAGSDELSSALKKVFRRVGELRQALETTEQRVREIEQGIGDIHRDQQRLRENMQRLDRRSDLYNRYVDKMNRQEDRLESSENALVKARRAVEAKRRSLADFIAGVTL